MPKILTFIIFFNVILLNDGLQSEYCDKDVNCESNTRYLFYDVNPPEGFNLRRDVYMRFAVFIHSLAKIDRDWSNFKLVLPPWSMLYHWKRSEEPEQLPWGLFFDIESMRKFAPVIEMHNFFEEIGVRYGKINIDEVYVMQHYKDMFTDGKFVEKMSIEKCNDEIQTNFFYYSNLTSDNIQCLSFHGFTSRLSKLLEESTARTILFDHGEVALHDRFGDRIYWRCRRSMRFSKDLQSIAREYRRKFLNSSDELDGTELPDDWTKEKRRRNAKGGPYLGVHLRRRDFVWGRAKHVPSLENAAKQIEQTLNSLNLNSVFIATDASKNEFEEIKLLLDAKGISVFKYKANKEVKKKFKEGGVAIIDQILCSYARYFLGTYESTFSFRIQEEREILGFPTASTFNRLCGNEETKCDPTSIWKIEY